MSRFDAGFAESRAGAMMVPSSAQSATGGAGTTNWFQCDSTEFDPWGMHGTLSNGELGLTVPKTGAWYVAVEVKPTMGTVSNDDVLLQLQIHRNGPPQWVRTRRLGTADSDTTVQPSPSVHLPRQLEAGDELTASTFSYSQASPASGPDYEVSGSPTETSMSLLYLGDS